MTTYFQKVLEKSEAAGNRGEHVLARDLLNFAYRIAADKEKMEDYFTAVTKFWENLPKYKETDFERFVRVAKQKVVVKDYQYGSCILNGAELLAETTEEKEVVMDIWDKLFE